MQRNDTLDRIFRSVGIDIATLAELRRCPTYARRIDMLRPGDIITLTHMDGVLQSLNRRISDTLTLSVSRAGDGFAVNYIENPLEIEVAARRARIDSSLFAAGRDAGMSAETIMVLANEIFGWDIDFANDIRAATRFSVIYQRKFQDGRLRERRPRARGRVRQPGQHPPRRVVRVGGRRGARLLHAGRQGHAQGLPARAARFHAHQLGLQPAPPASDHGRCARTRASTTPRPTGTPIYAAGDGRMQFAGAQGRLRQCRGHRPRPRHHHALWRTCRASASPARSGRSVQAGRDHRLRRHRPAPRPGRTCTTNTASMASTRIRRPSRCRTPRSRRATRRNSAPGRRRARAAAAGRRGADDAVRCASR